MEIISFEKQAFEEVAAKLDYFVQRIDSFCRLHGEKEKNGWMDNAHQSENPADPPRQWNACLYQNRQPDLLSPR